MVTLLSGPSQPPAAGGAPQQLVVFLHGYGADGADLLGLSAFFAQALPHAAFVAPNAPEPTSMGFGYQWFGLTSFAPELIAAGIRKSAPLLDAFIDRELAARGLTSARLGIIGFSQGTMMALDRATRLAESAAAVVGFSGLLSEPAATLPPEAKRAPILLVHGVDDPLVPFPRMEAAEAALKAKGFSVATLARPGIGHGIDPEGATRAAQFLAAHLGQ
jgi:phospholipase/carboxylesterase